MKYQVVVEMEIDSPENPANTLDILGEAICSKLKVTKLIKVEIQELEYKDIDVSDLIKE